VYQEDFLTSDKLAEGQVDVILSCMVIEHLPPELVDQYFARCRELLSPGGCVITLVPASMQHWGIEDDIAGHFKRYSFECFDDLSEAHKFTLRHISGLTFPISNWLLPLSNYLVNKSEQDKTKLTMQERTELSGNRDVKFKTVYPWYLKAALNHVTLFPFFVLQRLFHRSRRSLVIYSELVPH
ncbi:MAG: class I SAM-dependent methyltransferase, partial [Pseudomonadota bacterium]